jgi:NADH-quinone oxidoreductase subunit H
VTAMPFAVSSSLASLLYVLFLPGFLTAGGLFVEFVDRKLYARLQHRAGPPWYQPLADSIKLLTKEEIIPEDADPFIFRAVPLLGLAATVTAFFYVPLWGTRALHAFEGDAIVVLYLLTIPTLCFFLGGWFSTSLFATIGSVRTLTSLFAYEVPLFMAVLSPALLAGSWSLSGIAAYYDAHPWRAFANLLGFAVAIVALLGKLEKAPFDIPEAETELAGGTFTEYSGKLLAIFKMTIQVEAVVAGCLLSAVFLPWGLSLPWPVAWALTGVKVLFIVFVMALARTIFTRMRMEQMVDFCWRWVAPAALLQLLLAVVLNGVLP